MKRILAISASVAFLYILQSLPAYRLTDISFPVQWMRMQADIACIFCIYLGVREKSLLRGTLLAIIVGFLANAFAPSSLRIYTVLAPICFLLAAFLNKAFYFRQLEGHILLLFSISLFFSYAFVYLHRRHLDAPFPWVALFSDVFTQALMNAFFGAVIFLFFDWIMKVDKDAPDIL